MFLLLGLAGFASTRFLPTGSGGDLPLADEPVEEVALDLRDRVDARVRVLKDQVEHCHQARTPDVPQDLRVVTQLVRLYAVLILLLMAVLRETRVVVV
jgi:hypothetical protein